MLNTKLQVAEVLEVLDKTHQEVQVDQKEMVALAQQLALKDLLKLMPEAAEVEVTLVHPEDLEDLVAEEMEQTHNLEQVNLEPAVMAAEAADQLINLEEMHLDQMEVLVE